MQKRTFSSWFPAKPKRCRPARQRTAPPRLKAYRPVLDQLEDRRMLSVSSSVDETAMVAASLDDSGVVGCHAFYNNSRFDGGSPAPTPADDEAIAVDKQALLPGQTATFANYTSYTSGINGLMIDLSRARDSLAVSDFVFRVGNSDDPATWQVAPSPIGFSTRPGDGVGGSTRVSFTWPDGLIKNAWLEVTVLATPDTGLTQADVSYIGNAVGETGNLATNAVTTAADQLATRSNPRGLADPADITSRYDFNRDMLVDEADEIIARTAYNGQGGILRLITPPDLGASALPTELVGLSQATDNDTVPPRTENLPAFVDFVSADVVGRWVFYNNSQFDRTNPAANADDDGAIALDKTALLPGGNATPANYTSYSRGINGVMVDIAGLPGTPSVDDFEFRVGNSHDPDTWTAAPAPLAISVRRGAGVDDSDRVTITWPDNAIEDAWLQVTVKASPATGLTRSDVFYFGNLIADSGDNSAMPIVTAQDQIATRVNSKKLADPAPITAVADYNRDSLVNASDELIAVLHTGPSGFRMLSPPAAATTIGPVRHSPDFVHWGDANYFSVYGPTLLRAADGTLLYISEGRSTTSDPSSYAVVMRRSFDDGVSWTPLTTIFSDPTLTVDIGSPTGVVDEETGEIFVLFTKDDDLIFITSSTDSGLTWSEPRDITAGVKVTAQGNPNPDAFSDTPWGWYAVGPAHGIQLQQGPHSGRLLITADHRFSEDVTGISWSHVIYSDDHGRTWKLGGGLDQTNPANDYSNENILVEGSDGSIYMSIRVNNRDVRGKSRSFDGGMTWNDMELEPSLRTSPVHASLLRVDANTVLFSAPDSDNGTRQKMTIWISRDNMATWVKTKTVFYGYAAYSDMVLAGPDTVLLVFNGGRQSFDFVKHVYLVRFNLRWLESPDEYQFTWHFNEKAPGQATDLRGPSILDASLWDNRAIPHANTAADAPRYVAGPDGRTALSLHTPSDRVTLTQVRTNAFTMGAGDSFTVEAVIRTTDSHGMLVGPHIGLSGWMLRLSGGRVEFTIDDSQQSSVITSPAAVNDGNWHHIAAVRNAFTREVSLVIDGVTVVTGPDNTLRELRSHAAVSLGAASSGADQLEFDIDVLRVSRWLVPPDERLTANFAEPPRYAPPDFGSNAPSTISGSQLWLPAHDPAHYFADLHFADRLPAQPADGTAVHAAIGASPNRHRVRIAFESRQVLYAHDPVLGSTWLHDTRLPASGHALVVADSSGANPNNFDFIQNTGEFTISTFVKPGESAGSAMMLFDNTGGTITNSGFSLSITTEGALNLVIVGENSTLQLNDTSSAGQLSTDVWYHVAVVGSGPGQPVRYYVTPVSQSAVQAHQFGAPLAGPNANSPSTDDLYIGSASDPFRNGFNGHMVDQAIYNRALSVAEIQLLFDYTKKVG